MGNIQLTNAMQQTFQAQEVRELKTSIHDAAALTQNNNLDEVFFRAGGKDYVAFGENLNFDKNQGLNALKLKEAGIEIIFQNDESNGIGGGVSSALNSTAGKIVKHGATGVGALAGAGIALLAGEMSSRGGFVGIGALALMTGIGAGAGALVGYGSTALVGAIGGAVSSADMSALDQVTKK